MLHVIEHQRVAQIITKRFIADKGQRVPEVTRRANVASRKSNPARPSEITAHIIMNLLHFAADPFDGTVKIVVTLYRHRVLVARPR